MIITVKTTLVRGRYCEEEWSVDIELDELSTLESLHDAIQEAVDFSEDHLYCFFLSKSDWGGSRVYFDDENGLIYSTTLKELFPLPPKQCLFYLFDWGDEWVFKISRSRKRPHEPVNGVEYPRIVNESGVRPVQYPDVEYDDE